MCMHICVCMGASYFVMSEHEPFGPDRVQGFWIRVTATNVKCKYLQRQKRGGNYSGVKSTKCQHDIHINKSTILSPFVTAYVPSCPPCL